MIVPLKSTRSSWHSSGRAMGAGSSSSTVIVDDASIVVNTSEPLGSNPGGSATLSGERLGNTTVKVSGHAKRYRYGLRRTAAKMLPEYRVASCGHFTKRGSSTVDVMVGDSGAYYRNLAMCGSPWICPVCAARIAAERREELARALAYWGNTGGSVLMLTLTLQHDRDDDLGELYGELKRTWRVMKSGRWWQSIKRDYGIAAYVTAAEVTWGSVAGWHPHLHVLLFTRLPAHKFEPSRFKNALTGRWMELLERSGHYASQYYGLNVRMGDEYAGDYVAKFGLDWEISHAITKNGRGGMSPFELLDAYSNGAGWAGMLFKEYAAVFFGTKQLTWSHGARDVLGLKQERTDEEIAEDGDGSQDDERLLVLSFTQYEKLLKMGKEIDLLEVADGRDAWRVWEWLQSLGIMPEMWQAEQFMPLVE